MQPLLGALVIMLAVASVTSDQNGYETDATVMDKCVCPFVEEKQKVLDDIWVETLTEVNKIANRYFGTSQKQPQTTLEPVDPTETSQKQPQTTLEPESLRTVRQHVAISTKPRDCSEMQHMGSTLSGTYTVYTGSELRPVLVYCDMTTDNGGWTVFQRRQDGSENFYRNWVDYATGFGDLHREFWLGNANIYALTTNGLQYKLRIDLAHFNGSRRYAEYSNFKLGAPLDKYKLVSLGNYSGNAGDSLTYHVGHKFSTYDQDNDNKASGACARLYQGAWWFNMCHNSNLNGHYYGGHYQSFADGVNWYTWTGYYYSLRFTEMKIRPINH